MSKCKLVCIVQAGNRWRTVTYLKVWRWHIPIWRRPSRSTDLW